MRKKLTLLFALLCASVMGFAIDWSGYEYLGDGAGGGAYSNKYKVAPADGQSVVNIQQPGWASEPGIYTSNFGGAISSCSLGDKCAIDGGGIVLYLSAFTAKETEVTVVAALGTKTFTVYYEDGTEGGGGSPEPEPEPEPEGINWNSYSWLGDGAGGGAYSNKYKVAPAEGQNVVNIQQPGWASEPGIYTSNFGGAISSCSLGDKCAIDGGGIVLYLSAFTAKETEVTIVAALGTKTFTVYYEDGTEGGGTPEPTEVYDTNFALVSLGASATSDNGGTANNAIDNNDGSSWESTHGIDAVKLTIDLGQKRIFNTVQIRWEGAYGKAFTIDVSNDGSDWTTVKTVDEALAGPFPYEQNLEFAKTTAQYIRFNGTERGTQWGYNMFSFRVLLPGVSVLTSIDLTAPATIAQVGGSGMALTATPKDQNGQTMEATISYEITPAAAGHMSGNTFIPDQAGVASIRAYNGEIFSPAVTIAAYEGTNVALNKGDADITVSGYDDESNLYPRFAVDDNDGSLWSARVGETGAEREYNAWISVDLGAYYDINLIAIRWEGACSRHYHVDFSADGSSWRTAYNAGWDAVATHWEYLSGTAEDATKVRYVRVWSTEAVSQYGVKIMSLQVYGTVWESSDVVKPVMGTAVLVSSTYEQAVIAVTATDDDEVARYHVVDGTHGIDANFIPAAGNITVTGLTHGTDYNFTITAKDVAGNESDNSVVLPVSTPFNSTINLALNQPSEAGYEDGNPAELAGKANDGNDGSAWVTYADRPASEEWWIVDLGQVYTLTSIQTLWAGDYSTNYILQARVEAPSAADKANDEAWVTLATVTDAAADEENSTAVSGVGRYVRFRSITRSANCIRLRELRVFGSGVASVDTEAPVMSSASLVSNTDSHAIIAVAATDDQGVANYHVVDAGHSIDAHLAAEGGNITVSGLAGSTTYTFTITAVDYFGNESANSKSVGVTTTAHLIAPAAACPAPTWPAAQVKALYSPTYEADYNHQDWGGGTVATIDEFGRKYVTLPAPQGYFGADGFNLNCLLMEKLHYDIWIADDATIRIVPIWGGAEQGITVSLTGQQWNSIDIDLTEYTGVTNWGSITQMKIDNAFSLTFWIANAYFYREEPYVDDAAPYNAIASVTEESFYSVKIEAKAEDLSGAVNFKVMNGQEILATGAAATNVATTISVNNLASGTNYNFKVVAYDEAGNEAAPIQVAATTKFMPAPAPAPYFGGKAVLPVFTDAMEGAPATIHSGGWGETTIAQWIDIVPGDKVFYAQDFNYAGWHSWGDEIDATGMQFLHVDVYSPSMTSVSVTPISPGPKQGSAAIALTPNVWTSIDIALSAYEDANIDWAHIFQFKFDSPADGYELMIDNVFFWSYGVQTTPEQTGEETGGWATFAAPIKVEIPSGVKAYKAEYQKNGNGELLILTDIGSVIPANAGVLLRGAANSTYVFTPSEGADPDMSGNALVGCPARTDISSVAASNDIFCLRYSELYSMTGFFLYSGQYIPAGKAYLPLPKTSGPSGAPRHVRFVFSNEQTATGIGNVQGDNVPCTKVIENGQLFIRRGDAVYTIQGTRVQ